MSDNTGTNTQLVEHLLEEMRKAYNAKQGANKDQQAEDINIGHEREHLEALTKKLNDDVVKGDVEEAIIKAFDLYSKKTDVFSKKPDSLKFIITNIALQFGPDYNTSHDPHWDIINAINTLITDGKITLDEAMIATRTAFAGDKDTNSTLSESNILKNISDMYDKRLKQQIEEFFRECHILLDPPPISGTELRDDLKAVIMGTSDDSLRRYTAEYFKSQIEMNFNNGELAKILTLSASMIAKIIDESGIDGNGKKRTAIFNGLLDSVGRYGIAENIAMRAVNQIEKADDAPEADFIKLPNLHDAIYEFVQGEINYIILHRAAAAKEGQTTPLHKEVLNSILKSIGNSVT